MRATYNAPTITAPAWKTPETARTKIIGDTPSTRAASTVSHGSTSVLEMAHAAATPITPQCAPIANATMCTGTNASEKRNKSDVRSRAMSTSC